MQLLRFISSRGESITFENSAPFVFWRVKGLEAPPVTPVYTQSMEQHGYSLDSILMESRTITITGHIHGQSGIREMYQLRRDLNRVCNPMNGIGTLVYQNDAGVYRINAFCRSNPYEGKERNIQTLSVSFECPQPFFTTERAEELALAYVRGGLKFPLRTPGFFGTLGYRVTADNDGDIETPLEIFIGGGAINPKVINETTGRFVQVKKHIQTHEQLYINTDPEHIEVSLMTVDEHSQHVKINAYSYLSDDSDLLRLPQGVNMLRFNTDDNNTHIRIRLLFRKRFVGV